MRVMEDPHRLQTTIEDYFSLIDSTQVPPTPPGLSMAMGLRGWTALEHILKTAEEDPDHYPSQSVHCLHVAASLLEDYYLTHGLQENIPQAFTKFILSAYHGRSEKAKMEIDQKIDTDIKITIQGLSTPQSLTTNTPQTSLIESIL